MSFLAKIILVGSGRKIWLTTRFFILYLIALGLQHFFPTPALVITRRPCVVGFDA